MIYYANPSSESIRDAISAGKLGCITTPDQGNKVFPEEWDVVADNGCFSQKWNHKEWFNWLLNIQRNVRFVVAPDVFDPKGGECHKETLERWKYYGPLIQRHGFVPAFVCQIGSSPSTIPDDAKVVFIGGTTEWKLGPIARAITSEVKQREGWVHMGRVNSRKRIIRAQSMGCDSVDGTYLTYAPDMNLPKLLKWLRLAESIKQ